LGVFKALRQGVSILFSPDNHLGHFQVDCFFGPAFRKFWNLWWGVGSAAVFKGTQVILMGIHH
jgi:hypothetical protein